MRLLPQGKQLTIFVANNKIEVSVGNYNFGKLVSAIMTLTGLQYLKTFMIRLMVPLMNEIFDIL